MTTSRFAPSPTGRLHLGHAYSAALGRAAGTRWLLRIEDLDPGRSQPEFVDGILKDLAWLGLPHDGAMLVQSERTCLYGAALQRLVDERLAYPCFCTRADIAASVTAPHGDAATGYPGTCRGKPDDPKRRAAIPHSWRLDSAAAIARVGLPGWREVGGGHFASREQDLGDAVLARKDAPSSYHLACVVDDANSGVDLVVRGADLRPSTPIQRLLQRLLELPEPTYLHHPLVVHEDGRRLAKRDQAPTLAALRQAGVDGLKLRDDLGNGRLPYGFRLADA
ncbi:MAG: Glutamyl-Q tRNA(Asp) synthetase [uncultured Sphingomonas sp.]|uniref:Glutamyl-Q tRNA(Asp) synthetase n=1 Tax=uncultured Sphingomonas sp. TaxID=158754 RepID=A0A6J4S8N9_9SPHN|nr:tRNA glutamyl-Q(34) synthetase GluQRS [uncultured Sphingomonas sp.]CAA9488083.1 MAG: Glutamyl-Q tRNA(Asp) synthetase [uncultured Sphingomonas sp.]